MILGLKMVKTKELLIKERELIVRLWKDGKSEREISKTLGYAKSTIHNTISRFETRKKHENLPRSGRPRKTTARIDKTIVKLAQQSDAPSAVNIANDLAKSNLVEISADLVRKRLRKANIFGRALSKKPLLKDCHIKSRLQFAKKYQT